MPQMSLKERLIDLYSYIKQEEKQSKKHLFKLSEEELINYIQCMFDVKVKVKGEELFSQMMAKYRSSSENVQQYEDILMKYENDIRVHIKTENELRLIIDELQTQFTFQETHSSSPFKTQCWRNKQNEDLEVLKKENKNLRKLLLTYELSKEKYDKAEKQLRLKVYKQENENKTLNDKINRLCSKQKNPEEEQKRKCEGTTQKNSTFNLVVTRHPIIQKIIINTRSTSRKDDVKRKDTSSRTKSLITSGNNSFVKGKRNRSSLDISSSNLKKRHFDQKSKDINDNVVINTYININMKKNCENKSKNKRLTRKSDYLVNYSSQ